MDMYDVLLFTKNFDETLVLQVYRWQWM